MDIIFLGKPGSGKGTLSLELIQKQGYHQISGSALLRENSVDQSAKYYKEARHALDTGILCENHIINGMVSEKLKSLKGCKFVFDGYPRSVQQAETLLAHYPDGKGIKVIYLDVDDEVIIDRIIHRLTCKSCSASFNSVDVKPKVDGVCDHCGGELHTRKDDNRETLETRLEQYMTHTAPVMDFLKTKIEFEILDTNKKLKI